MLVSVLLLLWLTQIVVKCNSLRGISHEYSYNANITEGSNPPVKLHAITGRISLSIYRNSDAEMQASDMETSERLMHVNAVLESSDTKWNIRLEAVAEFQRDGMLRQLHVPDKLNLKTTELNILKGIISLFVLRASLEAGFETDSSGTCSVSYALVEQNERDSDHIVLDKYKQLCKPLQQSLDFWNYSLFPTKMLRNPQVMYVRYWLNKEKGTIVRALAHESLQYSAISVTGSNELEVISWQELILLDSADTSSVLNIEKSEYFDTVHIAQKLTQSENTVMHLGPAFSLEQVQYSCSLNAALLIPETTATVNAFSLSILVSAVENARDALHAQQLGLMEPLHQISQLLRLLRCLPDHPDAVKLLNQATILGPPDIEAKLLYRQANTWRNQLVEVLIGCGTVTCTNVIMNRLSALTTAAVVHKHIRELTVEEQVTRKMLFSHLWPVLSHIRQPTNEMIRIMLHNCHPVVNLADRHVCLMTISNLWPNVLAQDLSIYTTLVDLTRTALEFQTDLGTQLTSTEAESSSTLNSRIMIGLALVVKLEASDLLDHVIRIGLNEEIIWPSVRAAAIRSVASIIKRSTSSETITPAKINRLKSVLFEKLFNKSVNQTENILINTEIFSTLLALHLSLDDISSLFRRLGSEKRWTLISAYHTLARQMCFAESLPLSICKCIESHLYQTVPRPNETCDLGLAGGWSGLSSRTGSGDGQANIIYGDLFKWNNSLIIEYVLQLFTGVDDEFIKSNLRVNMLSTEGESQLLQFSINAHGLNGLADVGLSAQEHDETSWLNLEIQSFDTSLTPWTIFSGGVSNVISMIWSAPSEPTPILSLIRPVIDERQYASFSAGWLLSIDTLALISAEISGALEASIWSQSGRSVVRTLLGVVCESYLHVIHETDYPIELEQMVIRGLGAETRLDFITNVKVSELPDGVCMSINREDTRLCGWGASHSMADFRPTSKGHFNLRELTNKADYQIMYRSNIPSVSYDLGGMNSKRCNKMKSKNIW